MIEAVKSTVANSALQRGSVEQASTLNSFAANPEKLQIASQAPYVSPTVRIDVNSKIAILEFRESLSGEVLAQIPSEQAIRTYKLREAKGDAKLAAKLTEKPSVEAAEVAEPRVKAPEASAPQNVPTTTAPAQPSPRVDTSTAAPAQGSDVSTPSDVTV